MSFNPEYKATPTTLVEGQRSSGVVDSTGRLLTSAKLVGADGSAVASTSNPLPVQPIGGIVASATFTPTAAAYGAADIMGSSTAFAFTFAGTGVAIPNNSLIRVTTILLSIDISSVPAGQTAYTLQTYSATQPSAQADNDAWTLASADLSVYRGPMALGTPADLGNCNFIRTSALAHDFRLTTASLWGRLVTDGAHTAAATARTITLYGVIL